MEAWSVHHLVERAESQLGKKAAVEIQKYALRLISNGLPVILSLEHLGKITNTECDILRDTVDRRRETANYRMFAIKKRSGGRRYIHAVSEKLSLVHHFINTEILRCIKPHPCSYAFHSTGGIRNCAAMHCGARWLFQFDLADFFYDITEIDVYHIFKKMGYKKLLSFELARLCTTLHLPVHLRKFIEYKAKNDVRRNLPYGRTPGLVGVLPQGAATSPMLSNLVAEDLDARLYDFALNNGMVYTRYADDLTLSTRKLSSNMSRGKIHREIIHKIRCSGFKENVKKIRIAGPGSKKIVLGLLVDGDQPRISKEMYKRIERHLYAATRFGLVGAANHEGFDSAYGYYNHLHGLISFLKDVDKNRWEKFHEQFLLIESPLEISVPN